MAILGAKDACDASVCVWCRSAGDGMEIASPTDEAYCPLKL